jgi:hypothetical protein
VKGFSMIVTAAISFAVVSPAFAACKNAAGKVVQCAPKPVVKATSQAAAKPVSKTGCAVGGKLGPCKVKANGTNVTGQVSYTW